MKKLLLAVLGILIIGITLSAPTHKVVYTVEHDFNFNKAVFGSFFKEPFEILLIVFKDGEKSLTFTTRDEILIDLEMHELQYLLEKRGRRVKDIAFTVHNHLTPERPTPGDRRAHNALKGMGFKGPSFVYYPATGELRPVQ